MLPALLALAASVSPGPSSVKGASPVSGSLSGIFTADDYPPDALDLNQEGSVGVLVRINPKGAVSDCIVTSSSGSPGLDSQTCRVVWLRAKFTPARDASGAPVASTYQQSIVWRIASEDEGESSDPYMIRWIVSDWNKGLPSCRFEVGGAAEAGFAGPAPCPAYVSGIPGALADNIKPDTQITIEHRFSVGQEPVVTLSSTDQFIGRELARLDIDAAGKVVSCKIVDVSGIMPPQVPRGCLPNAKQYTPKKDARGSPAPFTAYHLTELYGHLPDSTVRRIASVR